MALPTERHRRAGGRPIKSDPQTTWRHRWISRRRRPSAAVAPLSWFAAGVDTDFRQRDRMAAWCCRNPFAVFRAADKRQEASADNEMSGQAW